MYWQGETIIDPRTGGPPKPPPAKQRPTKDRLDALMRAKSGNVNEVAKELGFEPRSVYRWLAEEGLDAASYRPKPPP
jgi:transcriptional regulator of acetoin/glycerol metabolism